MDTLARVNRRASGGMTLVEIVIVITIVGILAAIAYPSYMDSITRSNRAAARACLTNYATHMERFYTTNLRYDQDLAGTAIALPALDCASANDTGQHYDYSLSAVAANTFSLQAAPKGVQATRDTTCKTLTLTHTGVRGIAGGATGTVDDCW
ncbi:type IV pilin protein [Sinimarinibacterium flocculans]|uniref:Type IV pilus assembly protein PilE n=1 Tax=Sinimarinibacterium flocculans TaxID=985250 RepID=A0A318E8X2_9GAMM|nr:type IV pilin protein [Sinimarinibacterium flocculans]PXV68421.1 type IV pilus assembly protein PilE [Sinimarinibacterium flocculans]HCO43734.1 pilus assembly protein PilE [Gammaproteobacteria bacterium]